MYHLDNFVIKLYEIKLVDTPVILKLFANEPTLEISAKQIYILPVCYDFWTWCVHSADMFTSHISNPHCVHQIDTNAIQMRSLSCQNLNASLVMGHLHCGQISLSKAIVLHIEFASKQHRL